MTILHATNSAEKNLQFYPGQLLPFLIAGRQKEGLLKPKLTDETPVIAHFIRPCMLQTPQIKKFCCPKLDTRHSALPFGSLTVFDQPGKLYINHAYFSHNPSEFWRMSNILSPIFTTSSIQCNIWVALFISSRRAVLKKNHLFSRNKNNLIILMHMLLRSTFL